MAPFEKILAQLRSEHSSNEEPLDITGDRVGRWCAELSLNPFDFYNEIGLALARAFADGAASYEFCDDVANGVWGSFIEERGELQPFPKLFYSVYEAFDAGEYYHSDNREADPIETYTRPMIQRILEAYAGPAALSTARNSAP